MSEHEKTLDPLDLEAQLCFGLAVASRTVIDAYRSELEPLKLTHPQYLVMLALWQHGRTSLKHLAERLRLESATLSPMVKRLEAVGYVRRTRDAADERQLAVELTESGAALRKNATRVPPAMKAKLGLTDSELAALRSLSHRLIHSAEAARA